MVLHAADDSTVPVTSAREFVDALRLAPCVPDNLDYKEYKSGGHGEIMIQLMSRTPLQELTGVAREFVESVGVQRNQTSGSELKRCQRRDASARRGSVRRVRWVSPLPAFERGVDVESAVARAYTTVDFARGVRRRSGRGGPSGASVRTGLLR